MTRALRAFCLVGALVTGGGASADTTYSVLSYSDLDGWVRDDHGAALAVFRNTCADMRGQEWQALCAVAYNHQDNAARAFFELFFRPVLISDGSPALFTGYFEPELNGSRSPTGRYRYPLYRMPEEAKQSNPWISRREILTTDVMNGRGLEICWVDDPVELFFLQIQGSGRIRLPNGQTIRVGFGGSNGQPYRSIGVELVRRGVYSPHQVSAEVIKNWVRRNPVEGEELLLHNDSYVFFRELGRMSPEDGPLGAMNRSVTAMRSIAVDPAYTPLGAPVWIEKDGDGPLRRLMIAQDTGSAIKGAQRADVFFGTGDAAGKAAGTLKDPGRMVVLMPIQTAYALAPDSAG